MKNLIIAQSGGPTSAINATLAGAYIQAIESKKIDKIFGAIHGIQGVLKEEFIILNDKLDSEEKLELLMYTPAAALGSCRFKLKELEEDCSQYEQIIKTFQKYNIGYFIYIGGNDSMDTVAKLSNYCKQQGIEDIKIIGAPKTIDNDLMGTDHCPGFGSAAKYIATTFSELERDISVYDIPSVTIVEVMGRNAGWLTASSCLSRRNGRGVDFIYLCEREFCLQQFEQDIRKKIEEKTTVLVAVSEGIKNSQGIYISEQVQSGAVDNFGHKYIAGVGGILEDYIKNTINCKVRSIELNLMQRCSAHIASQTDLEESKQLGRKAVSCALDGKTGEMACILRKPSSVYETEISSMDINKVANFEKKVPDSWINKAGNDVTQEMVEYLLPLIQGEVKLTYQDGIPKIITFGESED